MNRPAIKSLATLIFSAATLLSASASFADYRVTAFGDTKAYSALIDQDVSAAQNYFASYRPTSLNFAEANNLCVTEILANDFTAAVEACELALDKIKFYPYISATSAKSAKASIYSNLAVATAMLGDFSKASSYLEVSLSFNSEDENALINYDLISANIVAAN